MRSCNILSILLVGAFIYAADRTRAGGKDESLVGTWNVVSVEENGKKTAAEELRDVKFIFTKDQVTVKHEGKIIKKKSYSVDSSKKPMTMDETGTIGKKSVRLTGIYKLEGDKLYHCFRTAYKDGTDAELEKQRPTKFDGSMGTRQMLIVLQRAK